MAGPTTNYLKRRPEGPPAEVETPQNDPETQQDHGLSPENSDATDDVSDVEPIANKIGNKKDKRKRSPRKNKSRQSDDNDEEYIPPEGAL